MAKCDVCHREMKTAQGCSASKLQFAPYLRPLTEKQMDDLAEGRLATKSICDASKMTEYPRIPYGAGNRGTFGARCHDCGAQQGHFHHAGCDWEECPRCHAQLISCGCNDAGLFSDVIESTVAKKGGLS